MSQNKIINKSGYMIRKDYLNNEQIDKLRNDLNVKPIVMNDDVEKHKIYKETQHHFIIPKYYGLKNFGLPNVEHNLCGHEISFKFTGKLWEKQQHIVNKCIEYLKINFGGILSIYCGAGKTVMALYIASQLGLKTIVLVHKTFLVDQWIRKIKEFTNASVGILRGKQIDVDKDIVLATLQSVSMIAYPSELFSDFGVVIVDECHHIGSRVYTRALDKVVCKYTIGFSATPFRNDGLTRVLNWYLGDIMYAEERKHDNVLVCSFLYDTKNKYFIEKTRYFKGKQQPHIPKMITNITKIAERNKFVIDIIDELRKLGDRNILVLSDRLEHLGILKKEIDNNILKDIENGLMEVDENITGFYIGALKKKEREKSENNCDILFATYGMAEEGLDIERLNTIILTTSRKRVKQAIGRILRPKKEPTNLLIVDIVDNLSVFPFQYSQRHSLYQKYEYDNRYYYAFGNSIVSQKDYTKRKYDVDDENVKVIFNDSDYDPNPKLIFDLDNGGIQGANKYPFVVKKNERPKIIIDFGD